MSAAERQRQHRARMTAGLRVYRATLNEEATEQLLKSFGVKTFAELVEQLNELDALSVTHNGQGIAVVLRWLRDELTNRTDEV